jgi:hypothetical protein
MENPSDQRISQITAPVQNLGHIVLTKLEETDRSKVSRTGFIPDLHVVSIVPDKVWRPSQANFLALPTCIFPNFQATTADLQPALALA